MSEAKDEAEQIWTDIGTIFGGAGTFTGEQQDGYAKAIIAAALQRHMDREQARWNEKEALAFDRDQLLEERDELRERAEKAEARLAAFDTWCKRGNGADYRQLFNDWVHSETNIDTMRARLIAADEGADYLHMCLVEQQTRAEAAEAAAKHGEAWYRMTEQWRLRTEAAETERDKARELLDDLSRELTEEIEAHRLTRQRLADLIGEVVEWSELPENAVVASWRALLEILAKYEQPE